MNHVLNQLILLVLISQSMFSQTKVEYADLSSNVGIDDRNKVGKEIYITKKDDSRFEKGDYFVEVKENNAEMTMMFQIDENGFPIGTIQGKYNKYKYTYILKDKIVERFDIYKISTNQLVSEEFKSNDSIVSNYYLENNQKILEKITYNGQIVYENTCRYDSNGLKLYMCSIRDEAKGEEISYDGERITFKSRWKNLPKGISKITERYDSDGAVTKKTTYLNGDEIKKTTNADGSYTVETLSEKGHTIKEYSKSGKLISERVPVYKTIN